MNIHNTGVIYPALPFVGVERFTNFLFGGDSFGSRYTRKPIKGSKDSSDSLVSKKNLIQKISSLDWRPESEKRGQKNAKSRPFVTSSTENPKPKTGRLAESVQGLKAFPHATSTKQISR